MLRIANSHSPSPPFDTPASKLDCKEGCDDPPEYPEYAMIRLSSMLQVVLVSYIVQVFRGLCYRHMNVGHDWQNVVITAVDT
jgi:hypothetical protein